MSIIQLTIKTLQAVLATSFAGDPNSDVSYPYLPGSVLRGALIGRYLRQSNLSELNLADPLVQGMFFDDRQTYYLNAYPVSHFGHRTLPTFRSWMQEKGADFPLMAYDASILNEGSEDSPVSPRSLDRPFWGYDDDDGEDRNVNLYQPSKRINIHNARDRSRGRGTETEGEIFCYEAINSSELFESIIICPDSYVAEFEKLLQNQDFWVGGSQSAGYGHIQVTYQLCSEPWREVGRVNDPESDKCQITLLSDVILRDEMGQIIASPDLLVQTINQTFGIKLCMHSAQHSYVGHTIVGGFNRKWGLPLPQMPALAMGSVLVLSGELLTSQQIKQIESRGIGERCIDGFGRLAVNLWKHKTFCVQDPPDELPQDFPEIPLTGEDLNMAETFAHRILRQRLEGLLQKKASELTIQGGKISNSQLSRLQSVARESINDSDCTAIIALLNNLPKNSIEQFDRAKVGRESLMNWIRKNIEKPGSWIINPDESMLTIGSQSYSFNESMELEYTLRLIMALAKKASKSETII